MLVSWWEECPGNKCQLHNRACLPGFFTGFESKILQGMGLQKGAGGVPTSAILVP